MLLLFGPQMKCPWNERQAETVCLTVRPAMRDGVPAGTSATRSESLLKSQDKRGEIPIKKTIRERSGE